MIKDTSKTVSTHIKKSSICFSP